MDAVLHVSGLTNKRYMIVFWSCENEDLEKKPYIRCRTCTITEHIVADKVAQNFPC